MIDANTAALAAGVATGVQFAPVTTEALRGALARLNALYRAPKTWTAMMRAAMKQPVGWGPSAATYAALYDRIARE